jgi:hypothetical protein
MIKWLGRFVGFILFGIIIGKITELIGTEYMEISLLSLIYIEMIIRGENNENN